MLKLEATLVATTAARPWRGGWSLHNGIDFIVWAPMRPAIAAPVRAEPRVACEPVSFLDVDDILAPGSAVVLRYVSLAAQAAEAAARDSAEIPLTRVWSSMARKIPGS